MVANEVVKYWDMAPIQTVLKPGRSRVIQLVDEHDTLRRNRSRTTATEEQKREIFQVSLKTLFHIASEKAEYFIFRFLQEIRRMIWNSAKIKEGQG